MKKITIDAVNEKYNVYIGDCLHLLESYIKPKQKVLIITDETVKSLHFDTLKQYVKTPYVFSLGKIPEKDKNFITYEACVNYCLNHFLDRNLLVLAFGGGVVTDFAGFFASTYKRGIKLIHLPTTILAHDSSVGGKTALNVSQYKNVVGSFYQPKSVIYHLPFLKTLKEKDIVSGFGEIFKHDLLSEGYLLDILDKETSLYHLLYNQKLIEKIMYHSILVKKLYIEMDIYDQLGKRQFLNLGHTLGHAIERLYGYSHGEAISLGICFDLFLSDNSYYRTFYHKLIKWGYFKEKQDFDLEKIMISMKNDKKNEEDSLKFIGLYTFGQPYEIQLTEEEFIHKFKQFKQVLLCCMEK